ncbi:MAG: GntR family transcriptional regulator [Oscillospiraceae bacterium]|mgnify:CR=1 FL=1|jgi:GntR family transcriptional regulator|nr:GntR family transcriptional regulator [Oscillospiraceae bacterium]MCI9551237.1 GntR family transcriptional regulator [Oscillospiraceae bacterium]
MLSLNLRDSRPIYEQVRDGLRRLIITGAIPPGDKLPSVRTLAGQLAINPNTIQRSYEALEREGYAYSVPGKGSFAALPQDVTEKRRRELFGQLDAVVQELVYLGMGRAEIAKRCMDEGKEETQ